MRVAHVCVPLVCVLAAAVFATQARPAASGTRLVAKVTRTGHVLLENAHGKTVKRLRAGAYTVVVRDASKRADFHLVGAPAVDKRTGLTFVGTRTWRLTLVGGTYRYYSDTRPTQRQSFQVTG
jgi:hypothetical protein